MSLERHKVTTTDELAEDGSRLIVELEGVEIGVFRLNGEIHAAANFCVHQSGPLCEGELKGQIVIDDDDWLWNYDDEERCIVCPWHGWKFDLTTGTNINDDRYRVPKYETEIEDGDVYVYR